MAKGRGTQGKMITGNLIGFVREAISKLWESYENHREDDGHPSPLTITNHKNKRKFHMEPETDDFQRNILFQGLIFRFHVQHQGCNIVSFLWGISFQNLAK